MDRARARWRRCHMCPAAPAFLYEVKVETSSGRKEVEVRASDGGVVQIEPDDND